jgi:hypothetical protein
MKHGGPRDEIHKESLSTIPVSLENAPSGSAARRRLSGSTRRRRTGVVSGICLAAAVLGFLLFPGQEHLSAPGAMNAGHERLACSSCHRPAPGTLRQQLQADAKYVLGMRQTPADFGLRGVGNEDCLACHARPFDRHPVFRFTEPRFLDVRATLAPHRCESCHREHRGARITVQAGYCVRCHDQLEMKNDPLDTSHAVLVREGRWLTCLGCHDFHGNHAETAPTRLAEAHDARAVQRYFEGGASPYTSRLRKRASQQRADQ